MHSRFRRSPIRLFRITSDARTNNVLPRRRPPSIPGNYMVEIQILPVENLATVLTQVPIALEDIVARELNLLLRHAIKQHQEDHPRDAYAE